MPTYQVSLPVEYPKHSGNQIFTQATITADTPEVAIRTLAQAPQVSALTADMSSATADEMTTGD